MSALKKIIFYIQILRLSLVYPFMNLSNPKLIKDIERWEEILNLNYGRYKNLTYLMYKYKEFRNIVIYRNANKTISRIIIRLLYPPLESLYIEAKEIGGGLFIQHGFSTMISAESIGENFWINQQVTLGYKDSTRPPIIGNNVVITCGAKVLGPIKVGDSVTIGANAVVVKDIPSKVVVAGIPAKIIKEKY